MAWHELCRRHFCVVEINLLAVGVKGSFPSFLQLLHGLESLHLTYGAMTGSIPEDIGNFTSLRQLVLIGNTLEAPLPASMFTLDLWFVNLAYNKFRGPFPVGFGELPNLGALFAMDNEFEDHFPTNSCRPLIWCSFKWKTTT